MSAQTNLLNAIAEVTGTTDKAVCITLAMKMLIDSGMSASKAYDTMFGDGAYMCFAKIVYAELRAKHA